MIAAIRPTSHKERESKLRQVIADLEAVDDWHSIILTEAGIGVFDWPLKTDRFYWSPIFKHLLGYADDELSNSLDAWLTRLHPSDRQFLSDEIARVTKSQSERYEGIHRMQHRDGQTMWFLIRATIRYDSNREAERLFGAAIDLSDFQESLVELLASSSQQTA